MRPVRASLLPPATAALAVALAATCTPQDETSGVILASSARLQVNPNDRISFAEAREGEEQAALVELRSAGAQVLTIESIGVVEDDGVGELALSLEPRGDVGADELCPRPGGFSLAPAGAPGSTCFLYVLYRPADGLADTGRLVVRSTDALQKERQIGIESVAGAPRIVVEPPAVRFEDVLPGETAEAAVRVWNAGTRPLRVTAFELVSSSAGDFDLDAPASLPAVLAPQDADDVLELLVRYAPERAGRDAGSLRILSDDPLRPVIVVELLAVARSRCVQVRPLDVDFGETLLGDRVERSVEVTNCGDTDVVVREIGLHERTDPAFSVAAALPGLGAACASPGSTAPCVGEATLEPSATNLLQLAFAPAQERQAGGRLTLLTDVPGSERIEVALFGRGVEALRPVACCEARVAGSDDWDTHPDDDHALQTIPLTTIQLRGSCSYDPDGSISRHKWTRIERPVTSQAVIAPAEASADPTFMPDVAGAYVLELEVVDDLGLSSRPGCQVHLDVVADGDLHVELTWQTPNDADEADEGYGAGSDLDLHLLHPLGDWMCSPRDCNFGNVNPDWGVPFSGGDDPRLDRDDVDGGGPENITLADAEARLVYRVGVHYFDDHGYGPAFATVRIYVGGRLQFELANKRLAATDDFWDVATVAWPSGAVTVVDRMYSPMPPTDCP